MALAAAVAEAQTVPTTIVLINRNSGQCVTNPGTSATPNLQMVQKPCSGSLGEEWTMQAVSGGYKIVSQLNDLCLAVQGNSPADGAAVVQYTCNNASGQPRPEVVWTPTANGSWVQLKHSGSATTKCLAVQAASKGSGAKLIQAGCSTSSNTQKWTMSPEPLPSLWSGKIPFPLVPVAAANMPDGRIVVWSAYDKFKFGPTVVTGQTFTSIYNPQTGAKTDTRVWQTGHDMFCPGTTMLPDGRLLVNGGTSSNKTSIFNPSTATWSASGVMNIPRGYQGNTLTSNGKVFTLGGSWSGGMGNKHAEVWAPTPPPGTWSKLEGVRIDQFIGPDPRGSYRSDNHLWLFGWSNGRVFHAGPAAQMHWIDTEGNEGKGAVFNAGSRGGDLYSINGTAVMYDKGLILKLGGAPGYESGYGNDRAYRININVAPVSVSGLAPMVFPRNLHNSVVLPNGQVVTVGGLNAAALFTDAGAVLMAELWNPATQKATRLSAMKTPRTYHSVALLLLDGRVFVAGGGLCGSGCSRNHPDAEILTPPYLLNANGTLAARPVIKTAPASAKVGTTISVTTDAAVTSFALVRMGAATHSVNNDQRRIPLPISGGSCTACTLPIPADPGVVLPGNYMLFAMNSAGRPSYAKVVNIPVPPNP